MGAGPAAGRRITVFGGSGFIGRHVVRRLAREGWLIRVAVRDPVGAAYLKPLGELGQIVPMRVHLADDDRVLDAALAGAEAAVNLVGVLYERGRQRFGALHADGPGRIARAAARAGARAFVHVSAIGADPALDSAYARTKGEGERQVRDAFAHAAILRPSIVFGAEDQFFNRFAQMARLLPALPLIGGGTTRFQPVYVGDVADAVMRCFADPGTRGKTYELGGPQVYTFKELMEYLLNEVGRRRCLVSLPFTLAEVQARFMELLPVPPLTRDQVRLLRRDNVVSAGALTLADLGIDPTPMEAIVPTYLSAWRKGGPGAGRRAA